MEKGSRAIFVHDEIIKVYRETNKLTKPHNLLQFINNRENES